MIKFWTVKKYNYKTFNEPEKRNGFCYCYEVFILVVMHLLVQSHADLCGRRTLGRIRVWMRVGLVVTRR